MIDIKFLSAVPMFSALSPPELEKLALLWTPLEKDENEIIFKRGDTGLDIYLIEEGTVTISLQAFDREQLTVSVLHAGDTFGELTLFDNAVRTATAIAFEKTKLFKIPRDIFIDFLKSHPDTAISLLGILGKRLRATNELIEKQTTRNVNDEMEQKLSFGERCADKFASFIGSWTFIIIFAVVLCGWILLNVYAVIFKPVDPYPFILLNLMLSCIAAIQAPVIMMSQGRQAKKDRISADFDYRINLKAELQIQEIHSKIDKVLMQIMKKSKPIL